MFHHFMQILSRDLLIAFRQKNEVALPLAFFVITVTFFPLGVSPEPELLRVIAPGVIWIAALLASLLSFETIFNLDYEDGALEQWCVHSQPLAITVLAKVVAHWISSGLPIVLVSPLLAMMLQLPENAYLALILSLLIGTPILSVIGAMGMAFTLGVKRGGVLVPLLILPLMVPVLIFGANCVGQAALGMPFIGQLALLGGALVALITLAPGLIAYILRVGIG